MLHEADSCGSSGPVGCKRTADPAAIPREWGGLCEVSGLAGELVLFPALLFLFQRPGSRAGTGEPWGESKRARVFLKTNTGSWDWVLRLS